MRRTRIRSFAVAALFVGIVGGCAELDRFQTLAPVTIYGRNEAVADPWFAIVPLQDPPEAVGFGADGVACLQGPIGSTIVRFDGTPGSGGRVVEQVGSVVADDVGPNVFWVAVAADGSLTKGQGVPAWWQGDPQVC